VTSAERVPHDEYTASLFDRREHAAPKYPTSARPWSKVTGICLHQTACHMGERLERYNTIGAHFVVTRSGKVLWMHGLERLVVHGNGWNNQTVGIEIDGLYAGIEGGRWSGEQFFERYSEPMPPLSLFQTTRFKSSA